MKVERTKESLQAQIASVAETKAYLVTAGFPKQDTCVIGFAGGLSENGTRTAQAGQGTELDLQLPLMAKDGDSDKALVTILQVQVTTETVIPSRRKDRKTAADLRSSGVMEYGGHCVLLIGGSLEGISASRFFVVMSRS